MFSTRCISFCPAWKDIEADSTFASVKPYTGLENLYGGQSNALCTYFVISVTKSVTRYAFKIMDLLLGCLRSYIMSQATSPPTHSFALFWHSIVVKMPTKSVGLHNYILWLRSAFCPEDTSLVWVHYLALLVLCRVVSHMNATVNCPLWTFF